jgi:Tau95 Triple barrel domain
MELRFRPEDPFCHPVFGELRPATALLLKISKKRGEEPSAQIVSRVNHAYHFEGQTTDSTTSHLLACNSHGCFQPIVLYHILKVKATLIWYGVWNDW